MCAALATKIAVGGDPEFFVKDENTFGLRSGAGLLGGRKHAPKELENGSVQEDGISIELNLIPSKSLPEFRENNRKLVNEVQRLLRLHNASLMLNIPEHAIPDNMWELPQLWEFGCDPDYDAWSGEMNLTPSLGESDYRFCGGHLHVSSGKQLDFEEQRNIAKWFDLSVGMYCVIYDHASRRAKFYGTPGRFRPTMYSDTNFGIEYRVPSNFWVGLKHQDNLFMLARWAMEKGLKNDFHDATTGIEGTTQMVTRAITDKDVQLARYVFGRVLEIHDVLDGAI